MEVKRYKVEFDTLSHSMFVVECPNGVFVKREDYEHLSDYCDRLVEIGKLPCLPKDLENLRNANVQFATENEELKQEMQALDIAIQYMDNELKGMENKWKVAVEMAAQAEVAKDKAIELRNMWHAKWVKIREELMVKVDSVKEHLDNIYSESY